MFEVERDRDDVVVTSDEMFDICDNGTTLVLRVRHARRLAEALLEGSTAIDMYAMEEDG